MSAVSQGRRVLMQAVKLRDAVQEDLRLGQFGSDDVNMKAYNDLILAAAALLPGDPVLGGMVTMPDAALQTYGTPLLPVLPPNDLGSKRLLSHLDRLVSRLELVLGESLPQSQATRPAKDVLLEFQSGDVRHILDVLEKRRGQEPKHPQLDPCDFRFITNPGLRQVLLQDSVEAHRAYAAGSYKASALLAGGLIEGMLMDKLQRPEMMSRPEYFKAVSRFPHVDTEINWNRVSLSQLIDGAREVGLLTESACRLAQGARDFRDTVHPNAELREGIRAGREEAQLLLALVELVHRDLAT